MRACRKSYHYTCAREDECSFHKESFTILCPLHIANEKDAVTHRPKRDRSSSLARSNYSRIVLVGSGLSADQKAQVESLAKTVKLQFEKHWSSEVCNLAPPPILLFSLWGKDQLCSSLQVTHAVCSVDPNRLVKRTLKYAAATLAGKWVVDISWVSQSVVARRLLPEVGEITLAMNVFF